MAMISRKKIISRSQSDLDYSSGGYNPYEVEEDVWYNKDKLYQDHIAEILRKWDQIDDEIWGKIICMERNRRIAKAYSRVPVLTISGSEDGFDGYKIGLNGFDNPMRDALTKTVKTHIGKGVRLKMDDLGNIIIKRMSNCDVFIRGWDKESNSLSKEIVDLSGELEFEKSVKLFDMKKFQASIARELRSAYPDRRKLENQCICAIAFVKDASDVLDLCSWVLLINIVALDLLKSRFPTMTYSRVDHDMLSRSAPKFVSIFEQQQQHALTRSSSDEDPYSLPSIPSSPSARTDSHPSSQTKSKPSADQKPPELPPRDFGKIKKGKGKNLPQALKSLVKDGIKGSSGAARQASQAQPPSSSAQQSSKKAALDKKKEIEYEDPYYCGLQARVPNFSGRQLQQQQQQHQQQQRKSTAAAPALYGHHQQHQQDMRKSQSSGYLNSLFNPSSSFHPKKLVRGSSHYSYYDSSLESDAYGISSGSGYDIYAPLNAPLYGRLRAQLYSNGGSSGNSNGGASHHHQAAVARQNRKSNDNHYPYQEHTQRYATEWD